MSEHADPWAKLSPAEIDLLGDGFDHTEGDLCFDPVCAGSITWAVERILRDRLTAAIARAEAAEARVAAVEALMGGKETPIFLTDRPNKIVRVQHHRRDLGATITESAVLVADLRAALTAPTTDQPASAGGA